MSLDLQSKHTMKQVRLQSVVIVQHTLLIIIDYTAKDIRDGSIEKAHSMSQIFRVSFYYFFPLGYLSMYNPNPLNVNLCMFFVYDVAVT